MCGFGARIHGGLDIGIGGPSHYKQIKSTNPMEISMPEARKRAYRHPKYKTSYRIKNWSEYEKSLRNRGDITVWLSQDAIDAWIPPKNGKRGGQSIKMASSKENKVYETILTSEHAAAE